MGNLRKKSYQSHEVSSEWVKELMIGYINYFMDHKEKSGEKILAIDPEAYQWEGELLPGREHLMGNIESFIQDKIRELVFDLYDDKHIEHRDNW